MFKKILFIGFWVFVPQITNASVYISEIMYDLDGTDSGREWVEVFNGSEEEIDLSTYYLYENNIAHRIKFISGESLLKPQNFAIIADNTDKFRLDYPNFSGNLFDSAFALNNSGEELVLLNSEKVAVDNLIYDPSLGAAGTGNSLQLYEGIFIPGVPTPGVENVSEPEDETSETETVDNPEINNSSNSAHSGQNDIIDFKPKIKAKTGIGRDRIVNINTSVDFEAYVSNEEKAKYIWNFGDGSTKKKGKVEYVYNHEGEYNVVLNAYFDGYKTTSRSKVLVIDPKLEVSVDNFHIKIKNIDNREINLGGFILNDGLNNIRISEDTIISKGHTINFILKNKDKNVSLYYPNGKTYYSRNKEKAEEICEKIKNVEIYCDIEKIEDFFDKI